MKIAWIGVGVMGRHMVYRLLNNNHTVYGFNRTFEKLESIQHENFVKCKTIAEAVKEAEVVFTMVGYPADVKQVYLDLDTGILNLVNKDVICVDMTTSDPELAVKLANNPKEIKVLDAPVTGGDIGALNGTLSIMVGGDKQAYEKVLPLFKLLGTRINYFGEAGSGQHAKLANQILVGLNTLMTAEIINYCNENNTDPSKVLEVLNQSCSQNWQLKNNGSKIIEKNYDPGFYNKHFIKDLNLIKQNSHKNLFGINQVLKTYENFVTEEPKNYNLGTQSIYKYFVKNKEVF